MTVSDELKTLLQTKKNIRKAITEKGVNVPDGTPFANYAERISKIGTEENINPYELFYKQRTSDGTNMQGLFAYANSPELDLSVLDTSQVTNMFNMFSSCTVPYLDLSVLDVSNVINMSQMFYLCSSEINIKGWDTKKLTNASSMFSGFSNGGKYLDLSVLDFSNVTQANDMFNNCNIDNIDIRNLNLNLAKLSTLPFKSVKGTVLDLSNYDITGLKSTYYLGYFSDFKTVDLTNWKTTEITDMKETFYYTKEVEKIIMPYWDMTNTTNTTNFFYNCEKLNYIDLSRSNDTTIAKIATLVPARKLATYGQMIIPADSSQANIEALAAKYWKPIGPRIDITACAVIPELDEIKPGKSIKLFIGTRVPWYGNEKAIEFISSDETIATIEGNVITSTGVEGTIEITARNTDTQEIISSPIIFPISKTDNYPNIIKFRLSKIPSEFTDIITVNGFNKRKNHFDYNSFSDIYTYDEGKSITSFKFLSSLKEIIKLNISNITDMKEMFSGMGSLIFVDDLNNWDTSNVTNMERMFNGCESLTELDVSNWDTDNVTTMSNMFYNCKLLTSLDVSNFDTSNVKNINHMFADCSSLKILDLSNFNIEKMETYNCTYMLQNCDSLHTLRLDNCNNTTINKIITSNGFPTNAITGVTRKIYCKESEAAGLTAPTNWVFEYVAEEPEIPVCEYCGEPGCDGSCQDNEEEPDIPLYVSGQFSNRSDITEVRTMVNDTHTGLRNMFDCCFNLASIIGIEDWDTSNVTTMGLMFNYCHKLTSLDLSSWNTSKVTEMYCMFQNCSNLTTVDLSNFDMTNVTNYTGMFGGCYELHTVRLDNCDSATVNKIISALPTGTVNGTTRKIYVSKFLNNITPPNGWVFALV